jgi:hypothetical protein
MTMSTTPIDLDAIKAQLDTITQGQWQYDSYSERLENVKGDWLGNIHMDEDAAFIVSAAETIRALVAEVEILHRVANLADEYKDIFPTDSQHGQNVSSQLYDALYEWEHGVKPT